LQKLYTYLLFTVNLPSRLFQTFGNGHSHNQLGNLGRVEKHY